MTVFVLGAGFSRAISDQMPLTDELGNLIPDRLAEVADRTPNEFKGGYFEAWLSRLAEPQPDLADHANFMNLGLFLQVTQELHSIMLDKELDVLKGEPPWWLCRFVGLLHTSQSEVITFNYDTLVERTVESLVLSDWKNRGRAQTIHVVRDTPPLPRYGMLETSQVETLRLLKLHGSLDSYWVSGDASGATINRWYFNGQWGSPRPMDESQRRQMLPGRSPFIVPPAAAKSAFYNNPVTRELWRTAAEALGVADRVALIGYSLPQTDLVTSGMLADALAGRTIQIDVVNRSPDPVAERLVALGVPASNIRQTPGDDAIARYTDGIEHEAGLLAAQQLKAMNDSRLLMVATSSGQAGRVVGIERRRDGTYVKIEQVTHAATTTRVRPEADQQTVSGTDLCANLDSTKGLIRVEYPDGSVATIVAVAEWRTDVGLGNGQWIVLVASAIP